MIKLSAEARRRKERWERRLLALLVVGMVASGAHAYGRYQRLEEATQRFERGEWAWDHGDPKRAEAEFAAALKAEPGFFPAREALSVIAWQRGDREGSLRLLREGVRVSPDDARAQFALGETLFLMHDFRAAIPPLEAAERLRPDRSGRPSLLATCRRALVDPPRFTRKPERWTRPGPHAKIHTPCRDHGCHEQHGSKP